MKSRYRLYCLLDIEELKARFRDLIVLYLDSKILIVLFLHTIIEVAYVVLILLCFETQWYK